MPDNFGLTKESPASLEAQRFETLLSYGILDTGPEEAFDQFTQLALNLFQVPISMISFVDSNRERIKSCLGTILTETARQKSFGNTVVESGEPLLVPDTKNDPRFWDNPLVSFLPHIRFYAGVPLVTSDGFRLGSFCIADTKPRLDLNQSHCDILSRLAKFIMSELELRRIYSNYSVQQDVNKAVAAAPDFHAALNALLLQMGHKLDAEYCLMPQLLENAKFYRFIAGVAIKPEFERILKNRLEASRMPISQFSPAEALTKGKIIDISVSREMDSLTRFPVLRQMADAGIKRVITIPCDLGREQSALMFGFKRFDVSQRDLAFIKILIAKMTPLLKGRLREYDLQSERLRLDYVNRAMRTLIGANHVLAQTDDETKLMEEICRIAVEQGGYTAAWVGFAEDDSEKRIRIVATSGSDMERLNSMPLTWADTQFGKGASGTAIREGRTVTMHNISRDSRMGPWRKLPETDRYGSCIAVPLREKDGSVFGVFTLYNVVKDFVNRERQASFDIEEEQLLVELARDMVSGLTMIRDRRERAEALTKQRLSETRLANVLASSPTIVYALEHNGQAWRTVEITQNFQRMTGYSVEEGLEPGWWRRHIHPDDAGQAKKVTSQVLAGETVVRNFRIAHKSGNYIWIRDQIALQPATSDQPARIIGAWLDITEKQNAEFEINRLAFYDVLTGVPNRRLFMERLNNELIEAKKSGGLGGILFLDLDRFKAINDVHGHQAGDQVLIEVAKRITNGIRSGDTVARLGGDEFVVLLPRLGQDQFKANKVVQRIAGELSVAIDRPIIVDSLSFRVTASLGMSLFPLHGETPENIVRTADIAMYAAKMEAKEIGKRIQQSNATMFLDSMQETVTKRHLVQNELAAALKEGRFEIFLQRQVDSQIKMVAAEALIRLRDVNGNLVAPADFIRVAEETGLIIPIGQWVRSEACRLLREFCPEKLPRISVNVSAVELRQHDFAERLLSLLKENRIDPSRLTLEITESIFVDHQEETIAIFQLLTKNKIRISIDDFGTGYSSLAYLQNLPISEIKIDKQFIKEIQTNERCAGLTQTIITLAKNFDFDLVAEGVELPEQAAFLKNHGCRIMQGYLFGRPTKIAEFFEEEALLRRSPAVAM